MWLNLADLIHHSVPDRKGNALPADVTSGTYDLEDLEPGLGGNLIEGKVALDKTWGHLTYGCLTCCGYSTPYLMLDPTLVGVGGGGSIYPYGANNCTGVSTSLNSYFSSTGKWWSGNTGIAQVTAFRGTGVAPGTTNGYASATVPSGDGGRPKPPCPQLIQQGQNNVKVQVPTASRITQTLSSHSVNSTNFPTCTGTQAGWYRQVQKIVTDQTGADMAVSGQNLSETVTIGTPNDLNITGTQVGTAVTDGNGNFNDTFFVCSSSCPASSGQTGAAQTISDVLSSGVGPYALSPNSLVYKCTSITINGK
jgi:hypothetical protein